MVITEKDKKLLCYVGGLLIIILAFLLGFRPLFGKYVSLNQQLETLTQKEILLTKETKKQASYEAEILSLEEKNAATLDLFPANIDQEAVIMNLNKGETETGIKISQITFQVVESTPLSESDSSLTGQATTIALNYEGSYEEYKDFIKYINENEDRMSISTISSDWNPETNLITGSMEIYQYGITGEGIEESKTEVDDVNLGDINIFHK